MRTVLAPAADEPTTSCPSASNFHLMRGSGCMRANERLAALTQLYFGGQLGLLAIDCRDSTDDECCEREECHQVCCTIELRESRDFGHRFLIDGSCHATPRPSTIRRRQIGRL